MLPYFNFVDVNVFFFFLLFLSFFEVETNEHEEKGPHFFCTQLRLPGLVGIRERKEILNDFIQMKITSKIFLKIKLINFRFFFLIYFTTRKYCPKLFFFVHLKRISFFLLFEKLDCLIVKENTTQFQRINISI